MSCAVIGIMCQVVDKLVKEEYVQIIKGRKRQALDYNMQRRVSQIKMCDFV